MKPLPSSKEESALQGEKGLRMVRSALAGEARGRDFVVEQLACVPMMARIKHRSMGAPLSADELDDVVQNVLMAVWKKLDQWDGRVPLEHWAYGFLVIELLKTIERRSRRLAVVQIRETAEPEIPSSGESVVDGERLKLAIGRLDSSDQEILRMKHYEDLTFDQIGSRTDTPTNTVKTRYYRCLKRLRDSLSMAMEV